MSAPLTDPAPPEAISAPDAHVTPSETACRASDGSERPMREVLAKRALGARQRPKIERETASRLRAGLIGRMAACRCSWPIVVTGTESAHENWCPAHATYLSELAVQGLYGGRVPQLAVTGMEAAESGIVHRDLKPDNVKPAVRPPRKRTNR